MTTQEATITEKHLPPDPDHMNDDRAEWAGECISLMSVLTGCEPGQEALGDFFCDVFHWGDRNGIPSEEMVNLFTSQLSKYRDETALDPFVEPTTTIAGDASPSSRLYNCCTNEAPPDWSQFDWLETGGCTTERDPETGFEFTNGGEPDDVAEFWTVYGRVKGGGCEAITDCATRELADSVGEELCKISGLKFG